MDVMVQVGLLPECQVTDIINPLKPKEMEAELTFRSYKPLSLEKGMWFINKLYPQTPKETILIKVLDEVPVNQESFLHVNGYPVEPYIVIDNHVLATPQQIAWFDEDPDAEYMSDVTISQLEVILNDYDGWLDIQMEDCDGDDEECQETPVIMEGKVIISYLMEYDEEEEYYEEYSIPCPYCDGDGVIADLSLCPECDGDGYIENDEYEEEEVDRDTYLDDDSDNYNYHPDES